MCVRRRWPRCRAVPRGGCGNISRAPWEHAMQLDVYVNYPGTCEEAFRFYERELGGRITLLTRHDEQPNQSNVPANWKKAVLHARLELGGSVLMGADIPNAEPMRSAYLTLRVDSAKEAEKLYALLSDGGEIFMKMEQTFF